MHPHLNMTQKSVKLYFNLNNIEYCTFLVTFISSKSRIVSYDLLLTVKQIDGDGKNYTGKLSGSIRNVRDGSKMILSCEFDTFFHYQRHRQTFCSCPTKDKIYKFHILRRKKLFHKFKIEFIGYILFLWKELTNYKMIWYWLNKCSFFLSNQNKTDDTTQSKYLFLFYLETVWRMFIVHTSVEF